MASPAVGLWWDYSRPAPYDATITVPIKTGNFLISTLTFLVGLAGVGFWDIIALLLHKWKAKQENATAFDLQQQVSLRNSPSSIGTLWQCLKIYRAWSKRRMPGLLVKTCSIAIPAAIIWAGFAVASVFVSNVATTGYGPVVARIQPDNCGFWQYGENEINSLGAYTNKVANDTVQARTYTSNFYANTSSSPTASSMFVRPSLPYSVSTSAPCPIPAADRCETGLSGAISMTTDFLDSTTMLGINAKPADRITLQMQVTCAPVHTKDLTNVTSIGNFTFVEYNLGPVVNQTNYTYLYNVQTATSDTTYNLAPFTAMAQANPDVQFWVPIPDFNRTDADISAYFLSQNSILYLGPVYDPWFQANGTYTVAYDGQTLVQPDFFVNVMVCADHDVMCNPTTSTCTDAGGLNNLFTNALTRNTPGFQPAQIATAARLINALTSTTTYMGVAGLGASALWASNRLFFDAHLS